MSGEIRPPGRRSDGSPRDRLEELADALSQRESDVRDLLELVEHQARRLAIGAVVGGLLVFLALGLGGWALQRAHNAAITAQDTSDDQVQQRFDALVQACEARNAQNSGVIGFLAAVDTKHQRDPAEVARDPRVRPFFPVHGLALPDGSSAPVTVAYCERYAHGLTQGK